MNRGVEISDEVADGPQSAIQQQVANGMAVRMAVLAHLQRRAKEPSPLPRAGKAG
jgi:aspartate carbamoyltransferase catalytic subunit